MRKMNPNIVYQGSAAHDAALCNCPWCIFSEAREKTACYWLGMIGVALAPIAAIYGIRKWADTAMYIPGCCHTNICLATRTKEWP